MAPALCTPEPRAGQCLLPPLASPPGQASFPISPSERQGQRLSCLPTYFSRCEETTVCSENALGNLGKGTEPRMMPAAFDPGQRRPGQPALGLPPPVTREVQQLLWCHQAHWLDSQLRIWPWAVRSCSPQKLCSPQKACSSQLDSDPQITSLAFNQGKELQAE